VEFFDKGCLKNDQLEGFRGSSCGRSRPLSTNFIAYPNRESVVKTKYI
jgi:hypothetical protein